MDNATTQKLKDAISKSSSIGIAVGRNPSLDDMAAALSLYLLLQKANKRVVVASPTDPIVEISSLVGIDKVQKSLGGEAGDLVVSFPYVEGEIEKVSYTLDEETGYLNIIVKASEQGLSFDDRDVKYNRGSGSVDLLFVVGTPQLSDLEGVFDSQKLRDTRIINIDNKESNQGFGDIVLVSEKFSSVSELVADIALSLGFQIDQDTAQNLLSGISSATKNFQDSQTSSLAFEMAAYLLKRGASRGRETREIRERAEELPRVTPQRSSQRRPQEERPQSDEQSSQEDRQSQVRQQLRSQDTSSQRANEDDDRQDDQEAPTDWLAPKVYKGSSNF